MALEERIATSEIKDKLNKLSTILPSHDATTYEFGAYLAKQLPDTITSNDFLFTAIASLDGFWHSEKGITDRAIIKAQLGHPRNGLYAQIPVIANATCPEYMAQNVQKFFDSLGHYRD